MIKHCQIHRTKGNTITITAKYKFKYCQIHCTKGNTNTVIMASFDIGSCWHSFAKILSLVNYWQIQIQKTLEIKIQIQKYKYTDTNRGKNTKKKPKPNEFGCQGVCMPYWKAVCKFVKLRLSGRAQCPTSYLSLSSETGFTRVQKYSRQEINYIGDQKYWRPKIRRNPLLLRFLQIQIQIQKYKYKYKCKNTHGSK